MAVVKEAELRSIAEEGRGRWWPAAAAVVSEPRTREAGLGCRRAGERLSRRCSLAAECYEAERILALLGWVVQSRSASRSSD